MNIIKTIRLITIAIFIILLISYEPIIQNLVEGEFWLDTMVLNAKNILIQLSIAWLLIEMVRILKNKLLSRFDMTREDNLRSRKLHTQINLLEKVIVFVIIISAIGVVMLSIESIRKIGIGLFASAGIAGIVLGLSAQKIFGAIFAGIQLAITQPFRIDDAVVVENEWGWIEEINLTYVVVKIWDNRRLVLPSTYFIDQPFQNWTRTTADLLGTVFLYTDYNFPVDELRKELTRLLESCTLWDKKVNVIQVTDSKENYMEVRILVSAKNSPTAWDLRVFVREKMIEFIQKNYPDSLPKTRVSFQKDRNHGVSI